MIIVKITNKNHKNIIAGLNLNMYSQGNCDMGVAGEN